MRPLCIASLWLGLSVAALAHAAEPITVSNAWVRATAPGQEAGAAYMELKSATDLTVVKVESTAADSVEIHKMSMHNGVMEMRMLEALELPAGKLVKLEPGGFHLMLFDLKAPLKTGENVAFTLHLKDGTGKGSAMKIDIPVKKGRD